MTPRDDGDPDDGATFRRIADKDPDSDSLWATWERVRRKPAFASRQEYIDLAVAHFGPDDNPAVRELSAQLAQAA